MFESKPIPPDNRRLLAPMPSPTVNAVKQQRLMLTALGLLVIALVSVLYQDRDFWFPKGEQANDLPQPNAPAAAAPAITAQSEVTPIRSHKKGQTRRAVAQPLTQDDPPAITATRTVLPALEVEVVAGSSHHKLRPGSNSVQIDLERGSSPPRATPDVAIDSEPIASGITKASERVDVSSGAADLVTHSVRPGYPMLARQMKVQGSVILQAIIGRDGLIQGLQVVSGPPILARAAQEAVKQWHFKPHYIGPEPVETQAKITVNFTISTN